MSYSYGQLVSALKIGADCSDVFKPAATIALAVTDSSAASAVLACQAVRLCATVPMNLAFAAAPTATSSTFYLPAGIPEYIMIDPTWKIAGLRVGAVSGTLFITKLDETGESY